MVRSRTFTQYLFRSLTVLYMLQFFSCTVSKTNYERQYSLVWKEIIKSEAWKNALVSTEKTDPQREDFYTSTSDIIVEETPMKSYLHSEAAFASKYQDLVARAYTSILVQAEKADARIRTEFEQWNTDEAPGKKDRDSRNKMALITKKYNAHQAMLQGLKSWNIFHEDRSGDLDFFKAENEVQVFGALLRGDSEESVVNLLVYKLADLYHFEEQ